ncbi:MAG: choice-of-anchor Q domain-containing protein [Chitinophagaceae bacterium]
MLLIFSCRKESFTDSADAVLTTNKDTLHFDTVFTTTGSISQSFKIFNNNSQGIRIGSIRLAGGVNSPFKINADGIPGPQADNISVAANDSLHVFVSVSINPAAGNLPFLVRDSIEIIYNGNKNWVQLEAYGQNAHFLRNKEITANESWNNDLPYVIIGGLVINENVQLTINKGSQIYVHADAPIIVKGTLNVTGEKWDSTRVIFTGDRLDDPYRDFPASWPGIFFTVTSKNNSFQFAIIKNAYQAVVVSEPASANPKLTLNETIIDNAYDAGLIGINTSITARNVLISNCGKNVVLLKGGNYQFIHCTVATLSSNFVQHKDPVLLVSNYLTENNNIFTSNLNALFRNCIFWGEGGGLVDNEVVVTKSGSTVFNVAFDRVLWRVKKNPDNTAITEAINDQDPQFDTVNATRKIFSFRLKEISPAINKGVNTSVLLDLDGNIRPIGLPDLGAYEKQ